MELPSGSGNYKDWDVCKAEVWGEWGSPCLGEQEANARCRG